MLNLLNPTAPATCSLCDDLKEEHPDAPEVVALLAAEAADEAAHLTDDREQTRRSQTARKRALAALWEARVKLVARFASAHLLDALEAARLA